MLYFARTSNYLRDVTKVNDLTHLLENNRKIWLHLFSWHHYDEFVVEGWNDVCAIYVQMDDKIGVCQLLSYR